MIELTWHTAEASGWRDRFAPDAFSKDADPLKHSSWEPSTKEWKEWQAQCRLTVTGRTAELDYQHESTRAVKERVGIFPDIIQLTFADESRTAVIAVVFVIAGKEHPAAVTINNEADAVLEGNPLLVTHMRRERDAGQRKDKLDDMRSQHGRLFCELCRDERAIRYAGVAEDRIYEVHHLVPLANGPQRVELEDLVLLCANCHRAVHGLEPMPSDIDALRRGVTGRTDP